MKTRTLLLLSVGVALAILLAGGVLLLQLSGGSSTVESAAVGEAVRVGDVEVTVIGAADDGATFSVDLDVGGVDDGINSFSLATGADRLAPLTAPADGRCREIGVTAKRCRLDFDVSAAIGSNRVLVLRRGDQQRNWVLSDP